ncbi:MAG: hypothetical protein JW934_14495, partial [Anaerolineae bacterium]|nr:hypothetical protein [Anaerolineae bacterium]
PVGRRSLSTRRHCPQIAPFGCLTILDTFRIEIGISGWIYTYALAVGIADETTAAYLNSAFWGAFTVGRLLAIPVAVRVRPRTILFGDLVLCLFSMIALVFLPGLPLVVWIGVMGVGLAIAPLFATTMSLAERLMPISGRVTGYFFIGVSSGSLVMPWLIGQLIEPAGPKAMMVAILVDVVLALLVLASLLFFFGDGRRESMEKINV